MQGLAELLKAILPPVLAGCAVTGVVWWGWPQLRVLVRLQERRFDAVLNKQLLMDIKPRAAMIGTLVAMVVAGLVGVMLGEHWFWFVICAAPTLALPGVVLNHLETKRRAKLEAQLIDGITSLSSGVRAGLTLVQSMQLLVTNATGPIKQEFEQLLREYEFGVDLNQAMLNASNRIGSSHYRLLFSAIQAHRTRGGDVAESLDRICEAVREIQRLDGKLTTLTAQGRSQAWMMALAALGIMGFGYMFAPDEASRVIGDAIGRLILLGAFGLVVAGGLWIRRIMDVDM